MKTRYNPTLLLIAVLLLLGACSEETALPETETETTEYHVAVVLPLDDDNRARWERTAQWALENIESAQKDMGRQVRLTLEWHDENEADMNRLGQELATRDDVCAIVGPYSSSHAQEMAYQCAKTYKTLIVPTASSAELVRAFSSRRFLWALTETDISQCEVLLAKAVSYQARRVALLAPSDIYGQTFSDWFAFQAQELGLETDDILTYTAGNRDDCIEQIMTGNADYAICVPSGMEDVQAILESNQRHSGNCPRLLFSDVAFNPQLLNLGVMAQNAEGVAMYAAPESGFEIAYGLRFGETPTGNEAQFYDALMLCAFAAADCMQRQSEDMNDALARIVDNSHPRLIAWDEEGMEREFTGIASGNYYNIYGAGGELDFDKTVYTNVLQSTYCNWVVNEGKFVIQDFCTSDGSRRSDANLAGWNWKTQMEQEFNDTPSGMEYAALDGHWALLVAASEGWTNYRHQADVLDMYQILKNHGYDDKHIILIMADDLAYNTYNPTAGEVRVSPDGPNLYHDISIDYKQGDLKPEDITAILNGERSKRLPEVIEGSPGDNVLVFWSGHGLSGEFVFGNLPEGFTNELMGATLRQLSQERKYRKMLWLIETCYSSSVAKTAIGVPGVLCIAAADEKETSKADVYSTELNVWMSNRFTSTLTEAIREEPQISFRDLYYRLVRNTIGSHVRVFNEDLFDNLYQTGLGEFVTAAPQAGKD